jgi:hypothetical protein
LSASRIFSSQSELQSSSSKSFLKFTLCAGDIYGSDLMILK